MLMSAEQGELVFCEYDLLKKINKNKKLKRKVNNKRIKHDI